jgi:hypothetical protein
VKVAAVEQLRARSIATGVSQCECGGGEMQRHEQSTLPNGDRSSNRDLVCVMHLSAAPQ